MLQFQPIPLALVGKRPDGRLSTTLTAPFVAPLPALLTLMAKLAPLVWPRKKLPLASFVICKSGAATDSVALTGALLLPALAVVTLPTGMLLAYAPALAATTLTTNVHELLGATVPPAEFNTVAPALGAKLKPEQPTELAPVGLATTNPAGNGSLTESPVMLLTALKLSTVMRKTEVCPVLTDAGEKLLLTGKPCTIVVGSVAMLLPILLAPSEPPLTLA